MRWSLAAVFVAGTAAAQWTPKPTATPRPTLPPPATATPAPPPATPVATAPPAATPTPRAPAGTCPTPALREFVFLPGLPVLPTEPGQSLRFADGTEFLVLVRLASVGEVPFRLVRVR